MYETKGKKICWGSHKARVHRDHISGYYYSNTLSVEWNHERLSAVKMLNLDVFCSFGYIFNRHMNVYTETVKNEEALPIMTEKQFVQCLHMKRSSVHQTHCKLWSHAGKAPCTVIYGDTVVRLGTHDSLFKLPGERYMMGKLIKHHWQSLWRRSYRRDTNTDVTCCTHERI